MESSSKAPKRSRRGLKAVGSLFRRSKEERATFVARNEKTFSYGAKFARLNSLEGDHSTTGTVPSTVRISLDSRYPHDDSFDSEPSIDILRHKPRDEDHETFAQLNVPSMEHAKKRHADKAFVILTGPKCVKDSSLVDTDTACNEEATEIIFYDKNEQANQVHRHGAEQVQDSVFLSFKAMGLETSTGDGNERNQFDNETNKAGEVSLNDRSESLSWVSHEQDEDERPVSEISFPTRFPEDEVFLGGSPPKNITVRQENSFRQTLFKMLEFSSPRFESSQAVFRVESADEGSTIPLDNNWLLNLKAVTKDNGAPIDGSSQLENDHDDEESVSLNYLSPEALGARLNTPHPMNLSSNGKDAACVSASESLEGSGILRSKSVSEFTQSPIPPNLLLLDSQWNNTVLDANGFPSSPERHSIQQPPWATSDLTESPILRAPLFQRQEHSYTQFEERPIAHKYDYQSFGIGSHESISEPTMSNLGSQADASMPSVERLDCAYNLFAPNQARMISTMGKSFEELVQEGSSHLKKVESLVREGSSRMKSILSFR